MKRIFYLFGILFYFFIFIFSNDSVLADEKINPVRGTPLATEESSNRVKLKVFYSTNCKACLKLKEDYLSKIISKYKDKIELDYLNTDDRENFKLYLALEEKFDIDMKVPSVLIGNHILIGTKQITSRLEPILKKYILSSFTPKVNPVRKFVSNGVKVGQIDLLQKFHSFTPLAVIAAGLIDGVNPCAFTVLIFFISFLTLMGYKKTNLALIGLTFILAVFFTYLALGLGLFRGLYEFKHFYSFLRITYYSIAALCFILAFLNLRDFIIYTRTKSTDSLKVKLPKPVRSRINAIITMFYRRDTNTQPRVRLTLIAATFVVGVLVSLLEAVCTGQVYLPTIVFILKEQTLRIKALFYLLLYNLMFVIPLLLILSLAILGVSSKELEKFFRKKIALIKIFMFIFFLLMGLFLLRGA